MKQQTLYTVWGVLFIICCVLGFLQLQNILLTILSVVFFVPGVLILIDSYRQNDKKYLLRLRYLSLGSLVLTLALLALSFASARGSETLGNALHYVLGVVSVPMYCSGVWVVSLFLWACLFVGSFPKLVRS